MMEWLRRFLRPPHGNFLELLQQQGDYAVASVEALQKFLKKPGEKRGAQARQVEREADEIQRILIHELEDTFVTPLDREDIFALSRAIDNFIDYVYDTVDELEILGVEPTDAVQELSSLLYEMAVELQLAIPRLLEHPRVANEHARRIKRLENTVEDTYRHSVNELFSGAEDVEHVMNLLKTREVLRHLSNAADQGDLAANAIIDIGIKWS